MEIVNIVQIVIHRLGTAKAAHFGGGFGSVFEISVETANNDPATLRELVISHAQEHGDTGPFDGLKQIQSQVNGQLWFDIQSGHMQYGQHYATCKPITALKFDGRYFKLDELKQPIAQSYPA